MEKMIVVVFENESKAFEGLRILRDLDSKGEVLVYETQIVAKEPNGTVRVIDNANTTFFPTIGGSTAIGALAGILGGPVGLLAGATAGALIGSIVELGQSGVTDEFVSDIKAALTPGKVAVVASVDEEWVTPLDTRMESAGGLVFRRILASVKDTEDDRDAAAHRAEMEQLKVERAQNRSDRLAKIDAKIDNLRVKLEKAIERKRVKMQLREQQREAKIQALQAKANQAEGDARRRQEARIDDLRRDYAEKVAAG